MLLQAKRDGKWGYINVRGDCVIDFKYDSVSPFSGHYAIVKEDERYGVIDLIGRVVLDSTHDLITVSPDGLFCLLKNNVWNCIDIHTKAETGYIFSDTSGFSEGACAVSIFQNGQDFFGHIDRTFSYIVKPAYESAHRASNGRLIAYDQEINCYQVFSLDGRILFQLNYESVGHYSEGLASVMLDHCKYGFVDLAGNLAIDLKFEMTLSFTEGLCPCYFNGHCGFIDCTGTFIVQPIYNGSSRFIGGRSTVCRAEADYMSWIAIDSAGNELYENLCAGMRYVFPGILKVTNDRYSSYLDNTFSVIWTDS